MPLLLPSQSLPIPIPKSIIHSHPSFTSSTCSLNLHTASPAVPHSYAVSAKVPPTPSLPASADCILDSGGGGGGLRGGGGGGGDGGAGMEGGLVAEEAQDLVQDEDVIVLTVRGMSCGGCAGKVKRILESLPQVSAATVNLERETAVVWVVPEVKLTENWKQKQGEMLANHLTNCGFDSNIQGKQV